MSKSWQSADAPWRSEPAVPKQLRYIGLLVDGRVLTTEQADWVGKQLGTDGLTKGQASIVIDLLKGCPEKPKGEGNGARPVNPARVLPQVPEGRYAITVESHDAAGMSEQVVLLYQIDRPTEGKFAGWSFVKQIVGAPGDGNRRRVKSLDEKRPILQAILDQGVEEARKLYADKTGFCGYCDALLTDEISRFFGYGPECAKNHQRPYGIKAARAAGMPELQKAGA